MSAHLGDCVEWLRTLPEASVDAIVTDSPYGLGKPPPVEEVLRAWLDHGTYTATGGGFMGREWDAFVPGPVVWRECFRVLKPGGHLVTFAGTRTDDWMGISVRLGGFEIRDSIGWVYYSGFPKSLDVAKAIETGGRPEAIRRASMGEDYKPSGRGRVNYDHGGGSAMNGAACPLDLGPEASRWSGFGTALKPAIEPAILARKPLDGTVAANVTAHGTGALNIDGCRFAPGDAAWVGPDDGEAPETHAASDEARRRSYSGMRASIPGQTAGQLLGRWPANLYACPKASRTERERGTDRLPARSGHEAVERNEDSAGVRSPRAGAGRTAGQVRNHHPTVKPVRLMRWLCRLVTPPGGLVVDPFLGSGTTGIAATLEGFRFAGAEREAEYHAIAAARMAHAARWPESWRDTAPGAAEAAEDWTERVERQGQVRLFGGGAR